MRNVVKVLREFDVENQDLKELFADPEWNGEAPLWFYILKEAEIVGGGKHGNPDEDGGPGRQLGPGRRAHRCGGSRRPAAKGPQFLFVLAAHLEADDTHRALPRPVHHGRSPQVRQRRLVLRTASGFKQTEVMNFQVRSRLKCEQVKKPM